MIYALVGRPRSGKSYEAVVFHIIPAIKKGRKVITNIPLNLDKLRSVFGGNVDLIEIREGRFNDYGANDRPFSTPDEYQTDWRNDDNQGPLFVVDEAHMVLGRQLDKEILYFYSMHGHHGIDIILVTQNLRKIHKDIKDMVELSYYCVKNTHLGTDKTYTKKVFLGTETKDPVSEEKRKYEKNYFPFYQSHTASAGAVSESKAGDVKSVYKTKSTIFGGFFILAGLVYLVFVYFMWFSDDDMNSLEPSESVDVVTSVESTDNSARDSSPVLEPLAGFDLFVTGHAQNVVYFDNSLIDPSKTFTVSYFDVYQSDSRFFSLNSNELELMGYVVNMLNQCVFTVSFGDSVRLVTCRDFSDSNSDGRALDVIESVPHVSI